MSRPWSIGILAICAAAMLCGCQSPTEPDDTIEVDLRRRHDHGCLQHAARARRDDRGTEAGTGRGAAQRRHAVAAGIPRGLQGGQRRAARRRLQRVRILRAQRHRRGEQEQQGTGDLHGMLRGLVRHGQGRPLANFAP